jgi:hypothetical protein
MFILEEKLKEIIWSKFNIYDKTVLHFIDRYFVCFEESTTKEEFQSWDVTSCILSDQCFHTFENTLFFRTENVNCG